MFEFIFRFERPYLYSYSWTFECIFKNQDTTILAVMVEYLTPRLCKPSAKHARTYIKSPG